MTDAFEPVIIAEFVKNSRERCRVTIDEYRDQILIGVRIFYQDSAGECVGAA